MQSFVFNLVAVRFFVIKFNIYFLSLIIFINILLKISVRPILISLTLPIVVISVDMLTWPRFILTDVIYVFLVISSIYIILNLINNNKIRLY